MNDNAKKVLMELFGINEVQAVSIRRLYFSAKTPEDILGFKKYYDKTILKKNFIGTTYEKLCLVCAFAELDLKLRFESVDSFLEWLFIEFKNRLVFQTKRGDFSYSYQLKNYDGSLAYDEKGEPILEHCLSKDALFYVNANRQICDENNEPLKAGVFYNALVNHMFKNQGKIVHNNQIALELPHKKPLTKPIAKALECDYTQSYLEYKKKQRQLYEANLDRFLDKVKQAVEIKKLKKKPS